MAKFSITVIRTDEYEIEIDENIWTPEYINDWSKSFYPAEDAEDIAKHLAAAIMNEGSGNGFMEGFGVVKTLYNNGNEKRQWETITKPIAAEDYTKGVSVKIITENDDYEYEIEQKEG